MTPIALSAPRVMLKVVGKSITFLLDMGAAYFVLPSYLGLTFPSPILGMGIDNALSFPVRTLSLSYIFAG